MTMLTEFFNTQIGMVVFVLLIVWCIIWKGLALWKSARKNHKAWFIILLIVNTLGILEILYVLWFSELGTKLKKSKAKKGKKPKRR